MGFLGSGTDCCCSKCGVRSDGSGCCLCACKELCVTVAGPANACEQVGVCDCHGAQIVAVWDAALCAWTADVICGDLSIDLQFSLKQSNGSCSVCLTSTCLNLTDVCQSFPTDPDGCGNHLRDCDQATGDGFPIEWTVDASGCGDVNCTSVTISISCTTYINPAGEGAASICKDCDCVCRCLCITLNEPSCDDCTVLACWNGSGWVATFTEATCCPGLGLADQTVTITIEADADGCCQWRLAVSLGTINGSAVAKTTCPDAGPSWTVDVPDTTHVITIACATCDNCGLQRNCCPNPIPETLTATIVDDGGCECMDGLSTTLVHDATEDNWIGTITVPRCTGDFEIDLTLECGAIIPSGNCRCFSLDTVEADCDSGRLNISPDSGCSCDPLSLTFGVYSSDCGGECAESGPGCSDVACTYKIKITE